MRSQHSRPLRRGVDKRSLVDHKKRIQLGHVKPALNAIINFIVLSLAVHDGDITRVENSGPQNTLRDTTNTAIGEMLHRNCQLGLGHPSRAAMISSLYSGEAT